jgi:hypothetical protein
MTKNGWKMLKELDDNDEVEFYETERDWNRKKKRK